MTKINFFGDFFLILSNPLCLQKEGMEFRFEELRKLVFEYVVITPEGMCKHKSRPKNLKIGCIMKVYLADTFYPMFLIQIDLDVRLVPLKCILCMYPIDEIYTRSLNLPMNLKPDEQDILYQILDLGKNGKSFKTLQLVVKSPNLINICLLEAAKFIKIYNLRSK